MVSFTLKGVVYQYPADPRDTSWYGRQLLYTNALTDAANTAATAISAIQTPVWHQVTTGMMLNTWEAVGQCAYTKNASGMVTIQFQRVANGGPGSPCFQLPSGFRPSAQLTTISVDGTQNPCMIDVAANGNITISDMASGDSSTGTTILVSYYVSIS